MYKGISLIFLTLALPSCTSHDSQKTQLKEGQMIHTFEYKEVSELEIVKADPERGEFWRATLTKTESENPHWEITSAPHPLQDRLADSNFVNHLLDTLSTLQLIAQVAAGSERGQGLEPPRFALRWKTPEKQYEVRIGTSVPETSRVYAKIPGSEHVLEVEGAALRMLEYVGSFDSIRQRTWSTLSADDVDQIEIRTNGKTFFYAQRDGEVWADRKHKPVKKKDTAEWLERLTHTRIKEFVDDEKVTAKLLPEIQKHPAYEIILTDRKEIPHKLQVGREGSRFLGVESSRAHAIFELYPNTLQMFVDGF